ncbi:MAG: hypothetical protein A2151_01200 [Candidatus Muproteobacteria bacterium RBG_16_65_34]|uniref:ABC transporter substrate-binding protein n=1 Tax=Candidatus Muproteobacteria bacterium RBG_16_65_34 TaxID=1817760 RepID=A0A1F6TRV9_9PROT|nr:MAG: hypothetical protein A2151_01200 [Candidatus Muproteobacteria bacterium RBG_16_65_34]
MELPNRGGRCTRRGRARGWRVACVFAAGLLLFGCAPPWVVPPVPGIDVVLSEDTPVFTAVAREIARRHGGPVETHQLGDDEQRQREVRRRLQESEKPVVVAVGLGAALLVSRLAGKQVVFCQVFNYEEARLPATGMKGVSATPPVREQFRYWKLLSPQIKSVGVVTGPGLKALLAEARAAARAHRIELIHHVARSDKEMLYAYKRMAPKVQGFWLLPDNRVLSRDSVRDLLAFSAKEGKQALVFTPDLLDMGALLSAESEPADVADKVLSWLRPGDRGANAPAVLPLSRVRVRINAVTASWMNLTLPPGLKEYAYAP